MTCRSWIDLAVPAGSTSEAAAVTAGVAGLLVSLAPGLAPEDIRSALVRSAAPLPTGGTFVRLGSLDFTAALNMSITPLYSLCSSAPRLS